jgi:hypothetical protein
MGKLGLQGRFELVRLIEAGTTFRQAAACLGVAQRPPTGGGIAGRQRQTRGGHLGAVYGHGPRGRGLVRGRCVSQEQAILGRGLRADAAAVPHRAAPFNDLDGAPPRRQPPSPHERPATTRRMSGPRRGRFAHPHVRAAEVRAAGTLDAR